MRVIIAVQDPESAGRLAAGALEYGISAEDRIAVVSVIKSHGEWAWTSIPVTAEHAIDPKLDLKATQAIEEAAKVLREKLHPEQVHSYKLYGHPHVEIANFANSLGADLVVTGFSGGHRETHKVEQLVDACNCPTLILGSDKTIQQTSAAPRKGSWWREPSYII